MPALSGKRITGNEEIIEQAARFGGVTVFPGWEFYAPVAGASHTVFDLLPRALVLTDELEGLRAEFDHVWSRIEQAHESSGVGNLVRPADLYLSPEDWGRKLSQPAGSRCRASGNRAQRRFPRRRSRFTPSPRHASTARFQPCSRK